MTPFGIKRFSQDITAGAIFLAAGLLGVYGSFSYPMGTALQMGSGYFPALVFGVLAALGAAILLKGLLAAGPAITGWAWRPVLLVLGGLVLFALVAQRLGFILSCMALVLISTAAASGLTLRSRLVLSLVLAGFCWGVFLLGLGILIPTWPDLTP